jgi:hypothetical protein
MTVKEIVKAYLVEHGFDGLCISDCGCAIDNLFPCIDGGSGCAPGYRVPADPNDFDVDFLIVEDKPGKEA